MQTNALLRSKNRAVVTLNSSMTLYSWLVTTTTNISVDCVVPENIHTPPPPPLTEGNGNSGEWGGSRAEEFLERGRGGGVVSMNFFFFQTGLNFHTVAPKVLLFAFCFLSRECKKNKFC